MFQTVRTHIKLHCFTVTLYVNGWTTFALLAPWYVYGCIIITHNIGYFVMATVIFKKKNILSVSGRTANVKLNSVVHATLLITPPHPSPSQATAHLTLLCSSSQFLSRTFELPRHPLASLFCMTCTQHHRVKYKPSAYGSAISSYCFKHLHSTITLRHPCWTMRCLFLL